MRILIDINHPAHVHLFKNFSKIMLQKGHHVLFTARDKDVTLKLLASLHTDFEVLGKSYTGLKNKILGLVEYNKKLFSISKKFHPDVFLSHGSVYAAQVSWLLQKPHITFEDTGNMEQILLYKPFSKVILTSTSYKKRHGKKQINYNGYHELAYLHPNFYSPNNGIYKILGVLQNQNFVLIRFVSWNASHDIGHKGISLENKIKVVNEFLKYAEVFISSEAELPHELIKHQVKISPEKMHDVLCHAILFYGESATMASECAVMGTPAIYLDNVGRGYTDEEEQKYGLVFNFSESLIDQEKSIQKGIELLSTPNLKQQFHLRRQKMLADKIDVTAFMVWFVENYPESFHIMKQNPDYQYRFK